MRSSTVAAGRHALQQRGLTERPVTATTAVRKAVLLSDPVHPPGRAAAAALGESGKHAQQAVGSLEASAILPGSCSYQLGRVKLDLVLEEILSGASSGSQALLDKGDHVQAGGIDRVACCSNRA